MIVPVVALALASCFPPAVQDPVVETPREAYVEGWFQETAEADLEAALRSYRRCVDLGGAGDRELVARALWRMGMIARARDEAQVAEELLGRVVEEFGDTQAAPRAREALESPVVPGGGESEAVQQARNDLRDILLAEDARRGISLKRLEDVFRTLTAEQILNESRRHGSSLATVLRFWATALGHEHGEKLLDLVFMSDEKTARQALAGIPNYDRDPLPERVVALAYGESTQFDDVLIELFAPRKEDDAMAALAAVAARSPELLDRSKVSDTVLSFLVCSLHPTAGEVFDHFLASFPPTREGRDALGAWMAGLPGGTRPFPILCRETPVGERLRAVFPSLPPARRDEIARQVASSTWGEPPRVVLDLLLEDPEAAVRLHGFSRLALSTNPEHRSELLERMTRETPYHQSTILESTARVAEPVWPLELLLEHTEGVLREHVYRLALSGQPGMRWFDRLGALRLGLDRKDPELITTIFAPTEAYRQLVGRQNVGTRDDQIAQDLQREVPTTDEESLATRLVFAAQASADERVRVRVHQLAEGLLPPDLLARYSELAFRDPSPRVRYMALWLGLEGVSREIVAALLRDPDGGIFAGVLRAGPGEAPLVDVLEALPIDRQGQVVDYAIEHDYVEVLRALCALYPSEDPAGIAERAFEALKTRDPDVLISAVTHPDYGIRARAFGLLQQLRLPEPLGLEVRTHELGPGLGDAGRRLQEQLRDARSEVALALSDWNIGNLMGQLHLPRIQQALAEELAERGERGRLLDFALDEGRGHRRAVGARGLVLLGDREAMRTALLASAEPRALITPALELGLLEDCIDLARSGRIETRRLVGGLVDGGHRDELARFVLGEHALALESWGDQQIAMVVDVAARQRDPVMLSRAVERFQSPAAVHALFELGFVEQVLEDLPHWKLNIHRSTTRPVVLRELSRLTGEPAEWSEYASEQRELIARWREKLGLPAGDGR